MKQLMTIFLLLVPAVALADPPLQELIKSNPEICRDVPERDTYQGLMVCIGRMDEAFEQRVNKQLAIFRAELGKLSTKAYRRNFETEQQAWLAYKKAHCIYSATGMTRDAGWSEPKICNIMENYKRLEWLKKGPSFP